MYICTIKYYSGMKNEIMLFVGTGEHHVKQASSKGQRLHVFPHTCGS
jgi:hypothetical protein